MEEAGAPPTESGKMPKKGGSMWMVATIIVAILLIASVTVLGVLPALSPSKPGYAKFTLKALDFAYERIGFQPSFPTSSDQPIHASQPIWFVFTNSGTNVHEFLLYRMMNASSRDDILSYAKQDLALAKADHPTWATNQTEANATLDEYNTLHDADARLTRYNNVDRNVDPGNTTDLVFVIREPGSYFFVCHQVDTTVAGWQIHQEHGMWGTLTISP